MTINQRIFKLLEERNLKSSDLASCLNIRDSTVCSWKSRGTNPPSDYLLRICEFLNISANYLLSGEEITPKLNPNESELLELFNQLPEREQLKVIGMVEEKVKNLTSESKTGKSSTSKVG